MAKIKEKLSRELIDFLQGERIISLITINKETKKPTVSTISWLIAQESGEKIKFALGHKASSIQNIESDPYVVLNVVGPGSCFEITGTGTVSEIMQGTMKYRVVTVDIESVEDIIFYGGKINAVPGYEKTYDPELAKKIDNEIYTVLKG
ncbi:PNPOx family protein [Schinkia azotoformans]|nr:pyridoxamine 5'-phosphate oxidase [Schinkia azotoformans]MEC1694414.1 pyridoxamine 5'-phosphate oxidase [Schinkia azotoformans]MEC1714453.1 pyridoxamine 5'-phosphate oxidase [Schinkia azotoformans]MEC1723225.1 pyridoxamine 5'-phosphate oxidase [Schinkia azotoformans]MEC1740452.1 pyridoxamine 5'-phosphate oxidase [Schinkia azotoformans]MEC1744991.1 pyridoxamine 5'-phosphate oxidase [Schinkia azotoformans]